MTGADAPRHGIVAVDGPGYLRAMLSNLSAGIVSVPLRGADDAERIERAGVTEVVVPEPGHGWLDMGFASRGGDALAQVSFTSGTEGPAKAVHLSRGNLHDVVVRLREAMALTDEVREYVGVPVHHSFGYGRARAVLDAGGRCYLPPGGFSPVALRDMLRAGEVNAVSAVPSLWRVVLGSLDLMGGALEAVRWIEIGSQHMPAHEKAALREACPHARIVQHYGLTEASRTTLQRIDTTPRDRLGSVGGAQGDVALRIDPEGRIEIAGPHVAMGVDDGAAYRPVGPWLRTGDLGRIEDGLLYYEGRADDAINVSGIKLSPDLIEAQVRATVADAGDFGVLGRPDPARGEGVLVVLGPGARERGPAIAAAVAAHARERGLSARGAIATRDRDAPLPRTATGKLMRRALAAELAEAPAPPADADAAAADPGDVETRIRACLGPGARLEDGASFHDLGGDSLMHLQMVLILERALGAAPPHWETVPLRELIARARAAPPPEGTPGGAPPLPTGAANMNPPGIGFRALVAEDFRANGSSLAHQGFWMLLVHRFGNRRMDVRQPFRAPLTALYRVLNKLAQIACGMKLDYTVAVGRRVRLEHFGGMILGARAIGDDVILRQNTTLGIRSVADLRAKPTLGARVDVGAGAVIVGDIHIGCDAIVGANTVVFANVPPGAVVMGVPGRIVGRNPHLPPAPDPASDADDASGPTSGPASDAVPAGDPDAAAPSDRGADRAPVSAPAPGPASDTPPASPPAPDAAPDATPTLDATPAPAPSDRGGA